MQNINLDITPGDFWQTLRFSQGDKGRQFKINVTNFEIPDGATIKCQGTKPSGMGFSLNGTASDNAVTFTATDVMTSEAGRFAARVQISDGDNIILGTCNFYVAVEENPHRNGTIDGNAEELLPELTLLVQRVEKAASDVLDMQVVAQTLPAGSQASYSYDETLNKATFGIPEGQAGAGAAGVVASAYSAAETYKVGDYVLYNSNLYRCTTAITTAEAWTAAHWTQIVLADDVSDLKSDLNKATSPLFSCDFKDLPVGASGILSIKLNEQTQSIPDGTELYLWFFQESNGSKYFYIKTGSNGVMSPDVHDICSAIVDNTQGDFIGTYTTRPYASSGQNATYYFDVVIDWGKVYKSNTLKLYDHALLNKEAIVSGNHYELVADADKIRNELKAVKKIVSPPIFYEDGVNIPERFKSILSIKLNEQTQSIPDETELYLWFVYKDDEQKIVYIKKGSNGSIGGTNDDICAWIKDTTTGDFIKQYTTIPFYSNTTYYFDVTVDWSKVPNSTEVVIFNNVRLNKDAIVNGYDRATYHYIDDKLSTYEPEAFKSKFNFDELGVLLPSQVFFRTDKKTPIYKRSLFQNFDSVANVDVGLVYPIGIGKYNVVDIGEPTNFGGGVNTDVENGLSRFILSNVSGSDKIIYRDCNVFLKNPSSLQTQSLKIMSLGDSLTQGGRYVNTPVTMLADGLEEVGISTTYIGSIVKNCPKPDSTPVMVHYEGRGGWRFRTLTGRESKYAGVNMLIPSSQTQSEWVVGVDGTIDEVKRYNPFLYPATPTDLQNYPEHCYHFVEGNSGNNKSYAEDSTLGDYVIFDPTRYFSLRNIDIPDVLTIAMTTNEWYLSGFDLEEALDACAFVIDAFRRASNTMKIVVIPSNTINLGREEDWVTKAFALTAGISKVVNNKRANGDTKLYCCPLYANGGRAFTFRGITATEDIDSDNDTQVGTFSNDVHCLYDMSGENASYLATQQYKDGLVACVLNIID